MGETTSGNGNSEERAASYPYVEAENVQILLEQEWKKISGPSGERGHGREGSAGLALSGGGIRSAIFSLGGLQALARAGWLEKIRLPVDGFRKRIHRLLAAQTGFS